MEECYPSGFSLYLTYTLLHLILKERNIKVTVIDSYKTLNYYASLDSGFHDIGDYEGL